MPLVRSWAIWFTSDSPPLAQFPSQRGAALGRGTDTQPPQMCSLLSLMVVSGIAKPPPHSPPRPVQNIVCGWFFFFFFLNKKKGAKARNRGGGII